MISTFFLEFKEDIPCFLKHWNKDDLIVALRPEVALELEIMNIPFQQLQVNYYTQDEYAEFSAECMSELKKMISALDEKIWQFNVGFKQMEINPFQLFFYYFKLPLDSIRIKIFELDKYFNHENIDEVKLITHNKRYGNDRMYFFEEESIYQELLSLMQIKYKYKLQAIKSQCGVENDHARFSCFRPSPPKSSIMRIAGYFKRLYKLTDRLIRKKYISSTDLKKKGLILSVNCRELGYVWQELVSLGWAIRQLPGNILDYHRAYSENNWADGFLDSLLKDAATMSRFQMLEINYFGLLKDRLVYFCKNIDNIINNYNRLSKYINKHNYDIIFFSTHTPHEMENTLLPLICREKKIPYVCWMHGGYGANRTVAGFDVSDFKFGNHYFVYGEEVKKLIDNEYSQYNLSTHVVGSPMLVKHYHDYAPPVNNKRVITLVLPSWCTNRLHVDTLNPYYNYSYWIPIKTILEVLIKYRNKYRIIVRAGSLAFKSQIETVGKFLKHHGAEEIEIIPIEEMPFTSLAAITDLFIDMWVSTTFWEECLTHADIFLVDNSDLTDVAKKIIPNRAFWHSDLTAFVAALRDYLDKGDFYQKSGDRTFLKSYLDYERKEHVAENVSAVIEKIIQTGSRK